ncbi:unnamed protein product [Paramecium octaurelia]|uniref:Uncharacterized protein n=1 Tax=Paramecium octaurelia TaxID=43137 RepID=A0A8S1XST7_PAROT|nr:unnamed protein product [Paramecium octaurelia]
MNYQILFYTQIIQNIWWIIGSLVFYDPNEYFICGLSIAIIIIRIILIALEKWVKETLLYQILYLLLNCLYTEVSIRMPMNNPFVNHSNSIMIIANYCYANADQSQNIQIISKLGFPVYSILRTLSITFIQSNYTILESCLINLIFLCFVTQDLIMQKIDGTQSVTKQLNLSDQHNFNSQFMTFVQQDSRRQSLGASLKKSRTHYSQQPQDKQEVFSSIPLYNKPYTTEDNIKNQFPLMHQKKSFNKKISIVSVDKADQPLHTFFQNLINSIFSAGVIILNQHQKVTFMNNKCEKLLGQRGTDKVLDSIKKIILENSLLEDDESPLASIPPRSQAQMNKATFERILKQHRNNQQELNIFDAFLHPQTYLNSLYQTVSPNYEFDQRSSMSESFNETFIQRKDAVTYEHIINQEGSSLKKLRIVIIPTYMTSSQQDQLSQPSLQKVLINKNTNIDAVQPIIVIKIKNITKKHKIEQMNKEKETHNTLLKSFSHELKTPLNSCQDMLLIIKDRIQDQKLLDYVEIAHVSIIFLIHQINDILDYAAMQSNTFKYRFTLFNMQELIEEIKYIYNNQLESKKIEFNIKIDDRVKNLNIRSDKQRIMQVLINLLNNSSKFTPQGGKIVLSIKPIENHLIKIQVKDSGIGIGTEQLSTLRKVLTSSMGKSLHRSRIKKSLGVGLNISARIVEGLVQKYDGTLEINSKHKNQGTKIYFKIEYQMSFRDETLRNPMISEYTNKHNTYKQMISQNEPSQLEQGGQSLLRQYSENSKSHEIMSPSKQSKNTKSRFYKLMPASQTESSLEMVDNAIYNIELPISPDYFRYKSQTQSRTCQLCTQCIQVLIVDDVPFNQIALKALLLHYKIQADQAYDGYQAIEMVKKQTLKHCQYYALIFMDIEMPGINGFQATREILEITQGSTEIVMCSAYDTEENFREGEEVGISEFLPKPVHLKDLERILRQFSLI